MSLEVPLPLNISDLEKLGLPRVLEVLHTCDWASADIDDDGSIGSLQDAEIDFELNAFDDDKENGSERDVEYMERMMAMLISARGNHARNIVANTRNGSGYEPRGA
jgi:hypothetical protein